MVCPILVSKLHCTQRARSALVTAQGRSSRNRTISQPSYNWGLRGLSGGTAPGCLQSSHPREVKTGQPWDQPGATALAETPVSGLLNESELIFDIRTRVRDSSLWNHHPLFRRPGSRDAIWKRQYPLTNKEARDTSSNSCTGSKIQKVVLRESPGRILAPYHVLIRNQGDLGQGCGVVN